MNIGKYRICPLHVASSRNHPEAVRFLISLGVKINRRDSSGKTPLYLACEHGNVQVLKILLANGADVNIGHIDGTKLKEIALRNGHEEIVELLNTSKVSKLNCIRLFTRLKISILGQKRVQEND